MKNPLYITSHGILLRKDNTLFFVKEDIKQQIPIHAISEINCHGKVTVKSGAASFLMKEGIVVNFFNKYGFYEGSLYPKIKLNSGLVVVKQSEHYLNHDKRIYIANEFVEGIKHNVLKTLKYYSKKGKELDEYIFKPIIVDRTIFKLVNNNMINKKHFSKDVGVLLNDAGKQIFISEYQKKLETTIKHPTLNKKVSYKYLIRLEGYKLIKHILNDQPYESFRMWW